MQLTVSFNKSETTRHCVLRIHTVLYNTSRFIWRIKWKISARIFLQLHTPTMTPASSLIIEPIAKRLSLQIWALFLEAKMVQCIELIQCITKVQSQLNRTSHLITFLRITPSLLKYKAQLPSTEQAGAAWRSRKAPGLSLAKWPAALENSYG